MRAITVPLFCAGNAPNSKLDLQIDHILLDYRDRIILHIVFFYKKTHFFHRTGLQTRYAVLNSQTGKKISRHQGGVTVFFFVLMKHIIFIGGIL